MTEDVEHRVELSNAGTYHGWYCTCGKTSRYLLPFWKAARNARAHENKGNRERKGAMGKKP